MAHPEFLSPKKPVDNKKQPVAPKSSLGPGKWYEVQTSFGQSKLVFVAKPDNRKDDPIETKQPAPIKVYPELNFIPQMKACYDLFSSLFHFYYFYRTSYLYLCKNLKQYINELPRSFTSKSVKRILIASLDCAPDLLVITPQYLFDSMFLGTKDGTELEVLVKQLRAFKEQISVPEKKKFGRQATIMQEAAQFDQNYREQMEENPKLKPRESSGIFDPVPHLEIYWSPVFQIDPRETPAKYRARQEAVFMSTFNRFKNYKPIRVHHRSDTLDPTIAQLYNFLAGKLSDHIIGLRTDHLGNMLDHIKGHLQVSKAADLNIHYDAQGQKRMQDRMEAAGIYSGSGECQLVSRSEWLLNAKYREVIEGIKETLRVYKESKIKKELAERNEKRLD